MTEQKCFFQKNSEHFLNAFCFIADKHMEIEK